MTDKRNNLEFSGQSPASFDDDVGNLVRAAGRRPTIPAANLDRMQASLVPLWQAQVEKQPRSRSWRVMTAIAAVLVVALALLFVSRGLLLEPSFVVATVARLDGTATSWREGAASSVEALTDGMSVEVGRSVATSAAARASLHTVTDHSLRLDNDTRIVFVSNHEVRLEQGAIYIDSGSETRDGDGLTVVTAVGIVHEIGTQFEVRLTADSLTVRVREGAISVESEGQRSDGEAGEQLIISGGAVQRSRIEPHDPVYDWAIGIVPTWNLDGNSLKSFLAWTARESGLVLEYEELSVEQEAAGVVLSGEVEGLTPLEALDAVLPAVGFSYRTDQGLLSISRGFGAATRQDSG